MKKIIKNFADYLLGDYTTQSKKALDNFLLKNRNLKKQVIEIVDGEFEPYLLCLLSDYSFNVPFSEKLVLEKNIEIDKFNFLLLMYKTRLTIILNYLKNKIKKESSILDIGDNSGFFVRNLTGNGISINIDNKNINYLKSKNVNAQQADAENLPFANNSFDYIFCFECLEHLENPLKALHEMKRICREKIYLTIPFVRKTRVVDIGLHKGQRQRINTHVFELSKSDFINVAGHAKLEVTDSKEIKIFSTKNYIYCKYYYQQLKDPSWILFELAKKEE